MSNVIQVKRRINGAAGSPGAPGAFEGELAVNFPNAAGSADKPAVWAFDGAAWRLANPDVAVSVGVATLPGGVAGSSAGIGAAYTALATKPTGTLIIATFGGGAYLKVGSANTDADWQSLGSSPQIATGAQVVTGTDNARVVTPLAVHNASLNAPTAAPANDADFLVRLGTTGKIAAGFLPAVGATFKSGLDLTSAYAAPAVPWVAGDFGFVTTAGAMHATWTAKVSNPSATVNPGDMVIFDGTSYHVVATDKDFATYIPKDGPTTLGATFKLTAATAAATTVILDGGTNKASVDNLMINCGTY